jgi:hypothetical protein
MKLFADFWLTDFMISLETTSNCVQMRLHFSTRTCGIFSIEVKIHDTIRSIKEKIQTIEPSFAVARQQLSWRQQVLADELTCNDFGGLENDDVIRLIIGIAFCSSRNIMFAAIFTLYLSDPPPPGTMLGEALSAISDSPFAGLTGLAFLCDQSTNQRILYACDGKGDRVQALRVLVDEEQRPTRSELIWDMSNTSLTSPSAVIPRRDSTPSLSWPADCSLSNDNKLLWIVSQRSQRILLVNAIDGSFIASFGERGHEPGEFLAPSSICVSDSTAHAWLWICDEEAHRVQCFDTSGAEPRFVRLLGQTCHAGTTEHHIANPCGVSVHDGRVFISEPTNDRVSIWDEQTGRRIGQIGGPKRGSAPGQLSYPRGLGVDHGRGMLYVSDYGNERLCVFSALPPFEFRGLVPVLAPCGAAVEVSLDIAFCPTVWVPTFVGHHFCALAGY